MSGVDLRTFKEMFKRGRKDHSKYETGARFIKGVGQEELNDTKHPLLHCTSRVRMKHNLSVM